MTSYFSEVCTLFQHIEDLETRRIPLRADDKDDRISSTIKQWFKSNRTSIDKSSIPQLVALLSTLLPERRPDRTYGIQANLLSRILPRALLFGNTSTKVLTAYKQPGNGDLGACAERAMQKEAPCTPRVTLLEADQLLDNLAGLCHWSDSALKKQMSSSTASKDQLIKSIYMRLSAREGKWMVRLILKNLGPVQLNEYQILNAVHFLLPDLLRFQNTFNAAATLLKTTLQDYPSACEQSSRKLLKQYAAVALKPEVGIKLGRPNFVKAHSIEHCQKMLGQYKWILERKYDGEYCEIHVDRSWSTEPRKCIKIFSKNGKDATDDRKGIIDDIVECLRLNHSNSPVQEKAILLGELVVWSDLSNTVLPFEEIRRHVTRSGRYLGTKHDLKPPSHEHLCMVFFDLLLLDENITMSKCVEFRRNALRGILLKKKGRTKSAEWKTINFGQDPETARKTLMHNFAASNAEKCEGLVLKPCGVPFFSLENPVGRVLSYIKLKKDYIKGLGDEADFAVIGASYNAQQAQSSAVPRLRYTDFHLGALMNKEEVLRFGRRPRYHFVGTIQQDHCIPRPILEAVNKITVWDTDDTTHQDFQTAYDIIEGETSKMAVLFREPLVFEVLGSGYVRPPDADYLMLRHPRVKKWHQDRTWTDCITFDELQQAAEDARDSGIASESQQNQEALDRLEATLTKKFARERTKTPSPKKRSPRHSSSLPTAMTLPFSSPPKFDLQRRALGEVSSNTVTRRSSSLIEISPPVARKKRKSIESVDRAEEEIKRVCSMNASSNNEIAILPDITPTTIPIYDNTSRERLSRATTPSQSAREQQRIRCSRSDCTFRNSVIYVAQCIAATPYIISDLLTCHDTTRMTTWQHCIRDHRRQSQHSATIQKSQAYPDMQRIVVVESRRQGPMMSLIETLIKFSTSDNTARVKIYDWRLLEEIESHHPTKDMLGKHFIGILSWDDTEMKAVFKPAH